MKWHNMTSRVQTQVPYIIYTWTAECGREGSIPQVVWKNVHFSEKIYFVYFFLFDVFKHFRNKFSEK